MTALLLWLCLLLQISSSTLCNSTEYALNIEQILQKEIGNKYLISKGRLIWMNNYTGRGNNPSGVYGGYQIPMSEEIIFGNRASDFLLHSHDAIIFAGCTPPKSKYYSVVSYLYTRYNVNITTKDNHTENNAEKNLFAPLGASLNHLMINTTNNKPFNTLTTIIHTGDNKTFSDIYNLLYNNKSINDINLQRIPNDYFNFAPYSINTHTFPTYPLLFDTLLPFWRIEVPVNNNEFEKYTKNNFDNGQTVFYLKYNKSNLNTDDILPFVNYTNISCTKDVYSPYSVNETTLYLNDFNKYTKDLINNISITYNYTFDKIVEMEPWKQLQNEGYECINQNKSCGGNNPDGIYWNSKPNLFNLTENNYFIVVGVNSFNNNLSVYESICYYIKDHSQGGKYANNNMVFNNFQYCNSTLNLNIKTNVSLNSVNNFYVIQFSRPKTYIKDIFGFNISYNTVDASKRISIQVREYLNPLTKTKPDYFDLISPVLVTFIPNIV